MQIVRAFVSAPAWFGCPHIPGMLPKRVRVPYYPWVPSPLIASLCRRLHVACCILCVVSLAVVLQSICAMLYAGGYRCLRSTVHRYTAEPRPPQPHVCSSFALPAWASTVQSSRFACPRTMRCMLLACHAMPVQCIICHVNPGAVHEHGLRLTFEFAVLTRAPTRATRCQRFVYHFNIG